MMASSPLGDIEDLALCPHCKRPFNETEHQPKVLSCKHHFCLKCINTVLLKGRELYCVHCWKRTEVPDLRTDALPTHTAVLALARRLGAGGGGLGERADACPAHAMPHSLWCATCAVALCRACVHPDHSAHVLKPAGDARAALCAELHAELAHMHKVLADVQHLAFKQREFLLKILEACTALKTQVETDLANPLPLFELEEARERLGRARHELGGERGPAQLHARLLALQTERERLRAKHQEMYLQCKLDDLIRNAGVLFHFDTLKRALAGLHGGEQLTPGNNGYHDSTLFLANYCTSQLYSRHVLLKRQQNNNRYPPVPDGVDFAVLPHHPIALPAYLPLGAPDAINSDANYPEADPSKANLIPYDRPVESVAIVNIPKLSSGRYMDVGGRAFETETLALALPGPAPASAPHSPQAPLGRNPTVHVYPIFYFNMEANGSFQGRLLIEVRDDAAPRMARNFGALSTGELGVGYKGCAVFQCWESESIITGDFESNNGRGGRSVFEDGFFIPEDTKLGAVRGSVGMRRSQKRHDNLGLVGSQFRVVLREMRGFTAIFAFVLEGLELVERISRTGDSAGKPQTTVTIASCGRFN